MTPVNVLIFEEDRGLLKLYGKVVQKAGYQVQLADSVSQAKVVLASTPVDVFLCDVEAETEGSTDLLSQYRNIFLENNTQVILMALDRECMANASRIGHEFFETKPPSPSALVLLLNGLCDRRYAAEGATPGEVTVS